MNKPFFPSLVAFCFLSRAVFAGEPNTLSAEESAAGWKLLFDGKTTTGWVALGKKEFPSKGWTVRDGTLHHEKAGGGGDIVTTDRYENFELTFDWKIGAVGNSGLKYNLPDPTQGLGFEFQLIDDEHHPDGIKGGALHRTGALYDLVAPAPAQKVNPVGEWNESRLIVKGNHVEQWVNGTKSVTVEMGSDELKALIAKSKYKAVSAFGLKTASPLLLQDHGDEVTFRNVKLRPLN
ncbi:MAG: hypothetical protein JWL90_896 [Chthoniobacteraceae bacterium]|nr:hypothetical protein [Chthoniobacteraceae bacterium]